MIAILICDAIMITVIIYISWPGNLKLGISYPWRLSLIFFTIATAVYFIIKILMPVLKIEKLVMKFGRQEINFDELERDLDNHSLRMLLRLYKETLDKKYSETILKKQAEINYLQSQINPHFLYNTLESIRGQAMMEGVDQIAEMTQALGNFFRYSISRKGNMVTLEEEIKIVDNYIIIQQYRFNNKFNVTKMIDDNDKVMEYCLPKLTIQPIVENAIYHGLETKIGKGNITIRVTVTAERMIINIVDDGIGIPQDKLDLLNISLGGEESSEEKVNSKNTGIALMNVNRRIKLNFGEKFGIRISSTLGFGTDVEIVLPLITNIHDRSENE
jgi:Putative regulator of cell autolysis